MMMVVEHHQPAAAEERWSTLGVEDHKLALGFEESDHVSKLVKDEWRVRGERLLYTCVSY